MKKITEELLSELVKLRKTQKISDDEVMAHIELLEIKCSCGLSDSLYGHDKYCSYNSICNAIGEVGDEIISGDVLSDVYFDEEYFENLRESGLGGVQIFPSEEAESDWDLDKISIIQDQLSEERYEELINEEDGPTDEETEWYLEAVNEKVGVDAYVYQLNLPADLEKCRSYFESGSDSDYVIYKLILIYLLWCDSENITRNIIFGWIGELTCWGMGEIESSTIDTSSTIRTVKDVKSFLLGATEKPFSFSAYGESCDWLGEISMWLKKREDIAKKAYLE